MAELFKLFPPDPTTDSKLVVVKERPDRESLPLNILGWRRILPNKIAVPIQSAEIGAYQCSALDSNCIIEVTISYKIYDKLINRSILSSPINLSKQLAQRSLYVIEPINCRISIDVENKKLSFLSDIGKFQTPISQSLIQLESFRMIPVLNITSFRNEFLRFYSDSLKRSAKFRSNHCLFIFNSKLEQDLFLLSFTDSFKQTNVTNNQIKLVGTITTTPRNEKELRNDGSASSLTSNNKSKNKNKQKVKISERLNLKKSCTKLTPNSANKIGVPNTANTTRCLNIFQQDNNEQFTKGTEQSSLANPCDMSMDLRGSFQQLQKTNNIKEDDNISNGSFRQKQPPRSKLGPIDEQNKKLRQQNTKLKKQIQSMSQSIKQTTTIKKKYNNAIQQLNRLQSQRIAIVKDKMKFQSAYYEQLQQKQKLKKQLQSLKILLNGQKNFKI